MTSPSRELYRPTEAEMPAGMIEHDARTAIRDLIRVKGFEAARADVARFLNDECERTRQ